MSLKRRRMKKHTKGVSWEPKEMFSDGCSDMILDFEKSRNVTIFGEILISLAFFTLQCIVAIVFHVVNKFTFFMF